MVLSDKLFEKAVKYVQIEGDKAAQFWGTTTGNEYKSGSAADIVTVMDRQIERTLRDKLRRVAPEIGFRGEEFGFRKGGSRERYWLTDPIDGTLLYSRGLRGCTTMLALVDENEGTLFGVIYDFIEKNMYVAEKGGGAFLNGEKIKVSGRPLNESMIAYETKNRDGNSLRIRHFLHANSLLVAHLCSGWEYAQVANGKLDARICYDSYSNDYDYAPGTLIVTEAGGVVANIGKRTFDLKNRDYIAANPVVFEQLTSGSNALLRIFD